MNMRIDVLPPTPPPPPPPLHGGVPGLIQSLDIKRAEDLSSVELLNPLGSLYPHVVALQLQSDDTPWIRAKNSPGYRDPNSWIDVYSTEDYSKPSARRNCGEFIHHI
ncbi:uncharacterized protein AFUA_3G07730 [Aspergillus fumigatus Af293]|uniref:Uncharacterized protein n=2 Tax=Aspergillus fumigatus TaxID=746128 RepID=Q4WX03_ASPFU|nr:conserved hypothetical protein [Aspergillus fumigatus Af293]EAL92800.1 conserved hypothetical protein [Aspergillus fumigatus Af293]EDP52965.1 conserved hypothetical protein [Aspergillus fumigatus A1163]